MLEIVATCSTTAGMVNRMPPTKKAKQLQVSGAGIWKNINAFADSPVGKLVFQFGIITIGGLVIANAWNAHVAKRQKLAHAETVKEQQYWSDRNAIFDLYEKYDLAVRQVKNAIDRGSISQLDIYIPKFQDALANWQWQQSRYYKSLSDGPVAFNELCKGMNVTRARNRHGNECYKPHWEKPKAWDTGKLREVGENCPRYMLFGFSDAIDGDVKIENVFSAFLASKLDIEAIIQSEWVNCLRATNLAADFKLLDCAQSKEPQDFRSCVSNANQFRAQEACGQSDGQKSALTNLQADIEKASSSWRKFTVELNNQRQSVREEAADKSRFWSCMMGLIPCSVQYWFDEISGRAD